MQLALYILFSCNNEEGTKNFHIMNTNYVPSRRNLKCQKFFAKISKYAFFCFHIKTEGAESVNEFPLSDGRDIIYGRCANTIMYLQDNSSSLQRRLNTFLFWLYWQVHVSFDVTRKIFWHAMKQGSITRPFILPNSSKLFQEKRIKERYSVKSSTSSNFQFQSSL